jgi:hypothetical protein
MKQKELQEIGEKIETQIPKLTLQKEDTKKYNRITLTSNTIETHIKRREDKQSFIIELFNKNNGYTSHDTYKTADNIKEATTIIKQYQQQN